MRGGDTYKALNLLKDTIKDTALVARRRFYDETKRQLNNTGSVFDPTGTFTYRGPDGLRPGYDKDGNRKPYDRYEVERQGEDFKPGHITETIGTIIDAPYKITRGLLYDAPTSIAKGTGALIKAYRTPSDKNIADIINAMEWFDKGLKTSDFYLNEYWRDESRFLENKIKELKTNQDIQGPIYTIARAIKQNIEGQNNLKNDIPQIPMYSTLRLKYLPHIKPLILSLRSSDKPPVKLEKFKKIKQHIDELLDMISTVQQEANFDTPYKETIWHFKTINDILEAAITELDPNSRPLEKQEEGAPTVPEEIIEEAQQDSRETQMEETQTGETKSVGGTKKSRRKRTKRLKMQ